MNTQRLVNTADVMLIFNRKRKLIYLVWREEASKSLRANAEKYFLKLISMNTDGINVLTPKGS